MRINCNYVNKFVLDLVPRKVIEKKGNLEGLEKNKGNRK